MGEIQHCSQYPFEETVIGFDKGEVSLDALMDEYQKRIGAVQAENKRLRELVASQLRAQEQADKCHVEEMERLRELVEEQARERHRWGGHGGAFEDCRTEVCVKARAALGEK